MQSETIHLRRRARPTIQQEKQHYYPFRCTKRSRDCCGLMQFSCDCNEYSTAVNFASTLVHDDTNFTIGTESQPHHYQQQHCSQKRQTDNATQQSAQLFLSLFPFRIKPAKSRAYKPFSGKFLFYRFVIFFTLLLSTCNANALRFLESSERLGKLQVQHTCPKDYVTVQSAYLTCDSPAAYYYGSNTYRNSPVCMSADRANFVIDFTISQSFTNEYGIYLEIESGCYNHFKTVLYPTDICELPLVNGTNACPRPGSFTLQSSFSVPRLRDYEFHYTPDLNLIFWDSTGKTRLGCASTGTKALHKAADRRAEEGWIALAIATVVFSLVFASLLWWSYRRKKRLEEALIERKKQHAPSYHYFRTLPNGQAVPIPAATRHNMPMPVVDASLVTQSNPSYNEPQVPTRPII